MGLDAFVAEIAARAAGKDRLIVALAGPPGAGKSTIARQVASRLPLAEVLQADGYHFDNALLDQLGRRDRKGAPDTFDIAGLRSMLTRLRAGEEVLAPVFDRRLDLARGAAVHLPADLRIIVVEGNYLALDHGPWAALRPLFDLCAYIEVAPEILQARLTQRWTDLGCTPAEIAAHVDGNDMVNVAYVSEGSRHPDLVLVP